MYSRNQHNLIALVLRSANAEFLSSRHCYFGGGTAIAMSRSEFRRSDDIDFLISDIDGYREIRSLVKMSGPEVLFRPTPGIALPERFSSDQYGIRGWLDVMNLKIKFEIVYEARIALDIPQSDRAIEGIATLSENDLLAEKLLANSDRFLDKATFNRDLIDLAFMNPKRLRESSGFKKASDAYGPSLESDLDRSIDYFLSDLTWIDRCLAALEISSPRAIVAKLVENLRS